MIYMRGQAADYDGWRQLGLEGWGWDDVLPVFRSHEDHFLGASAHHGAGGELAVSEPRGALGASSTLQGCGGRVRHPAHAGFQYRRQ